MSDTHSSGPQAIVERISVTMNA
ncbi:MAG: hypothetical protein QOH75_2876, partial [Actinomycetota bacterium]|nr:hypothetical protein [Actinomycetota bacterium]